MKYVSLDLETTGLDPRTCQILMISAVVEDTERPDVPVRELPHFTCFVSHKEYRGQAKALHMNGWIFDILGRADGSIGHLPGIGRVFPQEMAIVGLEAFLDENGGKLVLAGKNVAGFDIPFLIEAGFDRDLYAHHRTIDAGSVFIDWSKSTPPSLSEISGQVVTHNAYDDACLVIECLRRSYER
jgi:oligoribonuclease (3'-5' exoribonuclease)